MYSYLGISIEKLLEIDKLKGAKVLAGVSGMSKRVTKVNVMEVPDIIEWVSQGEFLLTTAYSIKDNINILLELIPKLNEKGVAGLGIKVGRYIKELPRGIIELANKLGFPVIEVPFNVSHADVISIILDQVINEQFESQLKIQKFNRKIMDTMMKGGSLKEIAKELYDNIGNTLAIYENMNDNCEIICDEDLDGNVNDQGLNKSLIHKLINDHIILNYKNMEDKSDGIYNESVDIIGKNKIKRVTIPIVIEKKEYGCIFIWIDKKELSLFDKILIESYVQFIALDFIKKLSVSNMERNYKLAFFNDLLSYDEKKQNDAIERAHTFNLQLELKYTVAIIYFNKLNFNKNIVSSLLFIINRIAKFSKEKVLFVDKSDRIIILYGSEAWEESQLIKKKVIMFCNKIIIEASKKFKEEEFKIGIGRSYSNVSELNKSNEQAKFIVEKLSKSKTGNILYYDDLGLYRILCFDGLQGELTKFCTDTIKSLVEYDKSNHTELVKTVKVYFKCNGNMKKISKEMFVHYNTIIYRLQKIKDITGLDIDNCDNRLNLEISVKALDLIEI